MDAWAIRTAEADKHAYGYSLPANDKLADTSEGFHPRLIGLAIVTCCEVGRQFPGLSEAHQLVPEGSPWVGVRTGPSFHLFGWQTSKHLLWKHTIFITTWLSRSTEESLPKWEVQTCGWWCHWWCLGKTHTCVGRYNVESSRTALQPLVGRTGAATGGAVTLRSWRDTKGRTLLVTQASRCCCGGHTELNEALWCADNADDLDKTREALKESSDETTLGIASAVCKGVDLPDENVLQQPCRSSMFKGRTKTCHGGVPCPSGDQG